MRLLHHYVWNRILSSCLSTEIRGLAGIFQQDATASCWCLQTCWQSLQTSTQKCTLACFEEYLPSRPILCKQEYVNTQNSAKLMDQERAEFPKSSVGWMVLQQSRSVVRSFSEGDDGWGCFRTKSYGRKTFCFCCSSEAELIFLERRKMVFLLPPRQEELCHCPWGSFNSISLLLQLKLTGFFFFHWHECPFQGLSQMLKCS